MVRKLLLINWYIIVSLLVLLAIVVSVLRYYPSLYQNYLPAIQDNISTIVGKPVQADAIRIDWHGITPHITVNNFYIYSDESKKNQLLYVKKALLSVNLYTSILEKKPNIRQLTLVGSNLEAIRTIDQRIVLNGIDVSERIAKRKEQKNKTKIQISLLDSTIAIKDEIKKLDYFFDSVDIELGFAKDKFKVTSKFLLPETLGNSLVLIADVIDIDQGFNKIKGNVYTKGKNINLELLGDFFPQLQVGISSGVSDFEAWGEITNNSKRIFEGKLSIDALQYKAVKRPIPYVTMGNEITDFETDFKLVGVKDSWNLALINSKIQANGEQWGGQKYEISCNHCNKKDFSISTALDYVDITNLISTLQHFPKISKHLEYFLSKVNIVGKLSDTNFSAHWTDGQLTKYMYKSTLQDSTILLVEQEVEISSLSGDLAGDHTEGNINISDDLVNFYVDKVSEHPFLDQRLTGSFMWKFSDSGVIASLEDIKLLTESLSAELQGTIQVDNGDVYLDIQGRVPDAQAEAVKAYLPYKKMHPKLSKWLKVSTQGGILRDGKLIFQGNPKYFPFKNKPGMFEVVASIDNGILDYREGWPLISNVNADFAIKNESLIVNGQSGKILNSSVNDIKAEIDDLKLPRLIVEGSAKGPADDILDFLQQSSLLKENSQIPNHINVSGSTNLDLNLIITLTKKLEKERLVSGTLEFNNSNLTVTSLSLPFTNLTGKLNFNKNGAEGEGIRAKLFGSNFAASAERSGRGRTLLTIFGGFDFDSYLATNHQDISKYLKGVAPITAFVNLPRFGKHNSDKSLDINIESNLAGLHVLLPKPFYKEPNESKQLRISTKYQLGHSYPIQASYGNTAFLQTKFNNDINKISALELRMGDNQFALPEQGIKISGKFDQLNIQDWKNIFDSNKNENSTMEIKEIDISADLVNLSNIEFRDVDFKLDKHAQYWAGEVRSSVAYGEFKYPLEQDMRKVATGTFEYLRFNKRENKDDNSIVIDPRKLPALQIQSKLFQYDSYILNDVELITSTSSSGMVINSITGEGKDLNIFANGAWEINANATQSTRIDVTLVTQNIHNSLNGFGFETGATSGKGSITAKLNWPNAPYKFSIDSLLGTANLRFKDGEITSVKPGAGRIIGLVNLAEISRRLSLDFKDFFSKGYVFDKIRGDLLFEKSNVTTSNLSIEGPSANILISGRTGITAKDYDQVVTVTPQVSGGLPWIGLVVGGPLGAVGVIVGEKVAKTIGIDVNKVTEVKYSMTGSWDDPKIEPIAHKVAEASKSTQGQPSPQPQPQKMIVE